MVAVVRLRDDYRASDLRGLACKARDGAQARRLMALAAVVDGKTRAEAAAVGPMDRQTLRGWVVRFNAEGPEGLIDRTSPGRPPKLTPAQKQELRRLVEDGPNKRVAHLVRWRRGDLAAVVKERFDVDRHATTIGRVLRELSFSHISPRPRHPEKDEQAAGEFKKNFAERVTELAKERPPGTPVEIWFQDEARLGQKNGLVYQWAKRGARPRQPKDQRHGWAHIFGAVCPAGAQGAALVLPRADTEAMQLHLQEISRTITPGAHGIVLMDEAGWHTTAVLDVPANMSLLHRPSCSPELNPQENVWQLPRQTYLSNRVSDGYEAIVEACCKAWNALLGETGRSASIATRTWATISQ